MAKELPYFKFYIGEWSNGDITLEDYETQGVFINICAYYWFKECQLSLAALNKKFKTHEHIVKCLIELNIIKRINDDISISFLNEQFSSKEVQTTVNRINGQKGGRPIGKKTEIKPNGLNFANRKESEMKANDNPNITNIEESIVDKSKEEEIREDEKKEEVIFPLLFARGDEKELFNLTKKIFLDFYKEQSGTGAYYFNGVDGDKIKSIIKKLIFKMKEKSSGKKESFTKEEMIGTLTLFFTEGYNTADDWLKSNFTLSNIDSKFNTIYTAIKNGKQSTKNGTKHNAATPEGVIRKLDEMLNPEKYGD